MKKAIALPLSVPEPALALWGLLLGELVVSAFLLVGGQAPAIAVRALQLFLRF